jgi:small-conductance mechanosensitive channel
VLTAFVGGADRASASPLQDILGNLFSGIILNFEDSSRSTGCPSPTMRGRVEQFGWRSFKIRTVDRS